MYFNNIRIKKLVDKKYNKECKSRWVSKLEVWRHGAQRFGCRHLRICILCWLRRRLLSPVLTEQLIVILALASVDHRRDIRFENIARYRHFESGNANVFESVSVRFAEIVFSPESAVLSELGREARAGAGGQEGLYNLEGPAEST